MDKLETINHSTINDKEFFKNKDFSEIAEKVILKLKGISKNEYKEKKEMSIKINIYLQFNVL